MKNVVLKKGKDEAVKRFHPWIFSGAIQRVEPNIMPEDGELVRVSDAKNGFLALGLWSIGSIAVRVISFEDRAIDAQFWYDKLKNAYNFRKTLGLIGNNKTNCFRLVHAEGDGLSGLIIDVYGDTVVIQCHSVGMHRHIKDIAAALVQVFDNQAIAIYDKSSETLMNGGQNGWILGETPTPSVVSENGYKFAIDWITGQKTGFFLDQRDNRQLLERYAKGKRVLNAFCYSGGFSVYALGAGAQLVHSVDISQKAIDLTHQNVALNANETTHEAWAADVMAFLKDNKNVYDVMIIDPPAFAKSMSKRHNAVQAYKRLNTMALQQITEGGVIFTFSCSQVVDRELFYNTIVAAAIEAGRRVRVMHHLTQPADHPVNMFHPEGHYLKGLVLEVI